MAIVTASDDERDDTRHSAVMRSAALRRLRP
jgi:hypothetical protein